MALFRRSSMCNNITMTRVTKTDKPSKMYKRNNATIVDVESTPSQKISIKVCKRCGSPDARPLRGKGGWLCNICRGYKKVFPNGSVLIPQHMRAALGIETGDTIILLVDEERKIITIRKVD